MKNVSPPLVPNNSSQASDLESDESTVRIFGDQLGVST